MRSNMPKSVTVSRCWKPAKYVGKTTLLTSIHRWYYSRSSGLMVQYLDGLLIRSDYTLREFERAIKKGYESASEVPLSGTVRVRQGTLTA